MSNHKKHSTKKSNEVLQDKLLSKKEMTEGYIYDQPVKWETPTMVKELTNIILFYN